MIQSGAIGGNQYIIDAGTYSGYFQPASGSAGGGLSVAGSLDGGASGAAFTQVFNYSKNGIIGGIILKNTDVSRSLNYRFTVTDMLGTTANNNSGGSNLPAGSFRQQSLEQGFTDIAAVKYPYKAVKLEVVNLSGSTDLSGTVPFSARWALDFT